MMHLDEKGYVFLDDKKIGDVLDYIGFDNCRKHWINKFNLTNGDVT